MRPLVGADPYRADVSQTLRLLFAVLFAALGALTVVPTPTRVPWLPSILVTEFGYGLAIAGLLVFLPGWRRSRAGQASAVLCVGAIVLLVIPVWRARQSGLELPQTFAASFGTQQRTAAGFANPARVVPFEWTSLVRPVQSTPVRFERRVFQTSRGRQLAVELYHPSYPHGLIPGVIVIPGESWHAGKEYVALNGYLAARDYLVAVVGEPLGPHYPFSAARDDLFAIITYLKTHAMEIGLDQTRLVILGRSLAGHLGLLVAYTANDPGIRGAISLYAPTDFRRWYANPPAGSTNGTRAALQEYLGGPPEHSQDLFDAASPIRFVTASSPPTLLVHGMHDDVVPPEESEALAGRLEQKGVPHLLVRLPWAVHGCDKSFAGPCGQITTYAVERFLNRVMVERDASGHKARGPRPDRRAQRSKTDAAPRPSDGPST